MAQQAYDEEQGPLMLAATDVLKPPPARIAKLGAGITLPRTVPVRSLAAAAVGAVLSLPFGLVAASLFGIQWIVFFVLIFGVAAVGLMQWEPQKGETLLRILGVRARTRARQQKVMVDGELLSVSIGVARLDRMAEGPTQIMPGAVEVAPGSVDERGVKRSERNRNLEPIHVGVPVGATGRLALPGEEARWGPAEPHSQTGAPGQGPPAPPIGTQWPAPGPDPVPGPQQWPAPVPDPVPGPQQWPAPGPDPVPGPQQWPAPVPDPVPGPQQWPAPVPGAAPGTEDAHGPAPDGAGGPARPGRRSRLTLPD